MIFSGIILNVELPDLGEVESIHSEVSSGVSSQSLNEMAQLQKVVLILGPRFRWLWVLLVHGRVASLHLCQSQTL